MTDLPALDKSELGAIHLTRPADKVNQTLLDMAADEAIASLPREQRVEMLRQYFRMWFDNDAVAEVAEAAIRSMTAGAPPPTFHDIFTEAEEWAALAAPGELRAYCWGCAKRLRPDQRQGLIRALIAFENEAA
ncbi:MAG: hypothetical protein AAF580_10115 [Pseudomonadota bacterium]